jgi:hypothetical protein
MSQPNGSANASYAVPPMRSGNGETTTRENLSSANASQTPRPRGAAREPRIAIGRRALQPDRLLPAAVLALPLIAVMLAFWPGHMSADTLAQFDQARSGDLTNHHAPILVALWYAGWHVAGAGPAWVLFAQVATFLVGLFLLLRTALRPLPAALVVAAIAFFPPVFGMLGYLGRDVWYMALLLLTFGLLAQAGGVNGRQRTLLVAGAVAAAWLTLAARQNAAAAVVLSCILLMFLVLPARRERGRLWRIGGAAIAGCALTLVLMASQFAVNAALGVRDVDPQQQLYIYDLAAISERERENLFPRQVLAERGLRTIDQHWNVDSAGPYIFGPDAPIPVPLSPRAYTAVSEAWREAVVEHPLTYLSERTELWLRQITLTRSAVWIYHPGIDVNGYGLTVRFPELNQAARDYVEAFAANTSLDGGPLYTVWVYLLISIAAAAILIRAGRPWGFVVAGVFALTALTYQSGLFLGAMFTQFRWEFPVMVSCLAALPFLCVLAIHRARGA